MEQIHLDIVHPLAVEENWTIVAPYILQAVGEEVDKTDVEYIKAAAQRGVAQIWVIHRAKHIEAVLVTETAFYGGRRTLVLRWLAGVEVEEWLDLLSYVEDWAYANQYERIEVWGRKGWEKVLRTQQYLHQFTVLGKPLARRLQ